MSYGIVGCGNEADAPTNSLALDATNDELMAFAHGVDDVGETAEEFQSGLGIIDCNELVKGCAGAESFFTCGTEDDDFDAMVEANIVDGFGEVCEDGSGKGIAGGMEEFDGGDSVFDLVAYITFSMLHGIGFNSLCNNKCKERWQKYSVKMESSLEEELYLEIYRQYNTILVWRC